MGRRGAGSTPVPPIYSICGRNLGILHHHQTPFPTGIRSSKPPAVFRKLFVGRAAPHTELLALRQQGAVLKRKRSRPSLRMSDGINGRDRPKECGRQYGSPAAWQSKMLAPLRCGDSLTADRPIVNPGRSGGRRRLFGGHPYLFAAFASRKFGDSPGVADR